MTTADVRLTRAGSLGHIELDRPRAVNALTLPMIRAIRGALAQWADDDGVRAVLLTGAGERGLCAGGDVVALRRDALAGGARWVTFFREEYELNGYIAAYPKPFVAVMDGLVLGGGVGVSAHGSVRVVTERSGVGMPETTIGFAPDVGGTYLLARAPGHTGTHLALTAGTMDAADAIAAGFADHYVPSGRLGDLPHVLADAGDPAAAVAALAEPAPPSALVAHRPWIDACYEADDVRVIRARLAERPEPAARAAGEALAAKSPTSLAVTLEALRRARGRTLTEVLDQELTVAVNLVRHGDFLEGVRAQLVDKDRAPRWDPPTLDDVGDVAPFFAPADVEAVPGPGVAR